MRLPPLIGATKYERKQKIAEAKRQQREEKEKAEARQRFAEAGRGIAFKLQLINIKLDEILRTMHLRIS